MRVLQRLSAGVAWLALVSVGTAMMLESAGVLDEAWRDSLSSAIAWVANPDLDMWAAALLGAALIGIAVLVVTAQFAPTRQTADGITVDRGSQGTTEVTSMVLYRAVGARLLTVPEVDSVNPVLDSKRLRFKIGLTDSGRSDVVSAQVREVLDNEFWATLGSPEMPVDLILMYSRGSTPVARKESSL